MAVPIIGLCIKASFWQLERAAEKEQLIQRLIEGNNTIVNAYDYNSVDVDRSSHRVSIWVTRRVGDVFYLDNRIQEGAAGYDILAEYLITGTDVALWINLGWVPGGNSRSILPAVNLPQSFKLEGRVVATPESFRMVEPQIERFDSRVRVQAVDSAIDKLVFAENVLDRDATGPKPRLGPEVHYGYSVQWFLLAFVLSGLTIYVFRRELK